MEVVAEVATPRSVNAVATTSAAVPEAPSAIRLKARSSLARTRAVELAKRRGLTVKAAEMELTAMEMAEAATAMAVQAARPVMGIWVTALEVAKAAMAMEAAAKAKAKAVEAMPVGGMHASAPATELEMAAVQRAAAAVVQTATAAKEMAMAMPAKRT